MSQPLRFALIGAGGVGAAHLTALETLENEGRARLICVADPFVEALANTKSSLAARGVRWHTDFQTLLEQEPDLDAVAIATPIPLHYKMAAAALARGLFVYLEKPPVPLIQQLNDLVALDTRQKVGVGFQMVSSQQVQQLKQWKVEGAMGQVESIRVSAAWPRFTRYYERAPWAGKMLLNGDPVFDGPATNALAHPLHNIMFLAGNGMDDFDAPTEVEGEFYRARPIESYDVASMRGRFESGITFHFTVTHATETTRGFRIEVIGDKGAAWISDNGDMVGNNLGIPCPVSPFPDAFLQSYRNFIAFATGKRQRAPTRLEDCRGYVLTTNGALASSGSIHPIDSKHWKIYRVEDEEGYDVAGIADLVERCASEGKLLSDLQIPWGRKGHAVLVRGLRSIQLSDYISH
ncbi:MAG: Gfo/Idh/MocA family oxidoreductase [Verrucomicrobia bacterium]|nr:Gfo/Idh/MocA family oxidoreductase [Verrucomicrobiota bacterium]